PHRQTSDPRARRTESRQKGRRSPSVATSRWRTAAWLADLSHGAIAGAIALRSNLLRRAVALDDRDVALDRTFHRLLAAARDDAVEERAVDHVERPGLELRAEARHRRSRERNDIGIAAHEAHVLAVGNQLHDVAAE